MKVHALTLFAAVTLAQAGALSLSGTVGGAVTPDTRLSAWTVKTNGQPAEELGGAGIKDSQFTLTLPAVLPSSENLRPVDSRISWPGIVDFEKASAPAQVAELRFYTYRDQNANGVRDENEALREVRLNTGKGVVFVVWASNDVVVSGSKGYQASLKQGWNALEVEVRSSVSVRPLEAKTPLSTNLGP
ncbi:hypothetical protein [Deinococcus sp.]|uniref:hypothetical protein n=1 Tax=Deinococcus sp. TaxID=47478 RepID=UPI0025BBDAF0|nr:hypothetical protein [Deinococcus sp.]